MAGATYANPPTPAAASELGKHHSQATVKASTPRTRSQSRTCGVSRVGNAKGRKRTTIKEGDERNLRRCRKKETSNDSLALETFPYVVPRLPQTRADAPLTQDEKDKMNASRGNELPTQEIAAAIGWSR